MTITWDTNVLSGVEIDYDDSYDPTSFSSDGITLTANKGYTMSSSSGATFEGRADSSDPEYGAEFTFSCATANITRIAITSEYPLSESDIIATGWSVSPSGKVAEWSGSAASINFGKSASFVTQIEFTTDEEVAPDVLPGVFSVSPTKTVHFSKGNLQYKASDKSWRFANKQYAVIGNNPGNSSYDYRDTQSAWIDLFGWGTGNQPWKASSSSYDYSSYTEWGSQFDTENAWYTLSYDEWNYLFGGRAGDYYSPKVSYAKGTVNGVGGLIIVPDDWDESYYTLNNPNPTFASDSYYPSYSSSAYSDNVISLSDWTESLEAHGAVFLPATGYRNYSCDVNDSEYGYYWTSTDYDNYAYRLAFGDNDLQFNNGSDRYEGYAVRLVSAGPRLPSASITVMPAAVNGLEYNGYSQTLITAGTAEGGELQYSTNNDYWSTDLPEGYYAGEYTVYYRVIADAEHEDYIPEQNQLHISISDGSDWDGNLATTTSNKRAKDGTVITGTLAANVKISILSGATVTLRDATINGVANNSYQWAGITCEGDATIILEGDNTIRGFCWAAGITVPVGSTLTIDGTGSLVATGSDWGAGIGAGYHEDCGNITINGGIITAIGNGGGAGIGSGYSDVTCGNITINGGIVTATGNGAGAGIGSGASGSSCGNITINGGIVTATGNGSGAGIGTGFSNCTCGNISITGGVINATTGDDAAGIGSGFSGCVCGNITISGGDITATGNNYGAGIGTGYLSTCSDITITCGHIVATRGSSSANPIGEGNLGTCGTVSVADYMTDDNSTPTRTISAEYATLSAAPTAITGLVYNGSAQTLINAGTAGIGTMSYSIDNIHWSTSLPTATEVGAYTVYYKVVGDATHNDYTPSPNTVVVNIKTTVYLVPGVWAADGAQFAAYVFNEGEDGVWSAIMTPTADGKAYKADVNAYQKIIFVRLKNTATSANWNDKWNQTDDLTFASANCFQITGWNNDKGVGRWRNYPFYYVQFQDYDDTVLKTDTVDSGNAATAPADPSRTGYAFTGWNKTFNAITSDLTITAQYEAIYNLTLKQNTEDADKWSVTPNTALAGTTIDLTYSGSKRVASVVVTPTSSGTPFDATETSSNHYQFTMPAADVEIEVEYHPFEGLGTAEDPYLIASEEDWNLLADKVAGGKNYADTYFRQTADISVTTMVGNYTNDVNNRRPFSGIYDGDGHTLTVSYNTTAQRTAPFSYVDGVSIKNLRVAGSITTSQKYAAGFIGKSDGDVTLYNCRSSVAIHSSVSGDGTHGGFVGSLDLNNSGNNTATFEGCVFDGKLLGSSTNNCGGFVGWSNLTGGISLIHSLYAPEYDPQDEPIGTSGCKTFMRTSKSTFTTNTSYYTATLGGAQGKQLHSITAGSGVTVTNAGEATEYIVSGITSYGTGIKYNGVLYAGEGDELSLNLTHAEAPVGHSFSHYSANNGTLSGEANPYTLTMADADAVIDANYSVNQYTITWKDGDGNTLKTEDVAYGSTPAYTGNTPTKTATAQYNYSFTGWSPAITSVTGDATYTAQFESSVRLYDVYWLNWDNDLLGMNRLPYGETPSYDLDTPTKEGDAQYSYTFAGWDPAVAPVTGDAFYKATFNQVVNKYTITWKDGDGNTLKTEQLEFGEWPEYTGDTPTKTATAEYTYTFKNAWSPEVMPVIADATYTAQFDAAAVSYTLAWNAAGGELSGEYTDGETAFGTTIVAPTATLTGYTFAGWSQDVPATMPAEDVELTAQWTEIKHDVAVEAGANGQVSVAKVENIGIATASGDITATANTGYHFVNWTLPEGVTLAEGFAITDATIQINATADEKTITANFAVTAYTLAWELNGGEVKTAGTAAGSVNYGAELTAPLVEKTGYAFAGWDPEVATTMPAEDATYTATWTINQYTISFNSNGGSAVDPITQNYGTAITAPAAPTRTGYTFAGWTPAVPENMPAEDVELTAQWEINTYKVTFAAGENGSVDLSAIENVAYGSEVTIDGNKLTIGTNDVTATPSAQTAEYTYVFVEWANAPATITGTTTITATFSATKRSYTIKFVNGEEELQSEVFEYGVLPAYKGATPTKAATAEFTYTFKGWDAEIAAVTGEATYMATFTATKRSYTITWLDDDNSQIDQTVVEYGAMPAHGVPTKAADAQYTYTFDKWSPSVDYVTGDATYKATYIATVNTYKVMFAAGENGSVDLSAIENVAYGSEVTIDGNKLTIGTNDVTAIPSAQTAEYTYAFVAWENAPATITGATTITATFSATKRSYVITFKDEDGTVLSAEEWFYGTMPECDEPTKAEDEQYTYAFKAWTPEVVSVTGEATYTATYEATEKPHTPTDIGDVQGDNVQSTKVIIDQHVYILRDGKTYTVTGQEVK